jgi:hypothetical protein
MAKLLVKRPAALPRTTATPRADARTAPRATATLSAQTLASQHERPCTFEQTNPKRKQTKSFERYELYKAATTLKAVLSLGGTRADILHDVQKGFVTFDAAVAPAVSPAADAAEVVAGAADKALGVSSPTGSCEGSESSSEDDDNARKSKSAAPQVHSFSSSGFDSRDNLALEQFIDNRWDGPKRPNDRVFFHGTGIATTRATRATRATATTTATTGPPNDQRTPTLSLHYLSPKRTIVGRLGEASS